MACTVNCGATNSRRGTIVAASTAAPVATTCTTTTTAATANAAGTAHRGKKRIPTSHTRTTGSTPAGFGDRPGDRTQAQLQQHSGEHGLRHRCGDPRDEIAQRRYQPGHEMSRSNDEERPDGRSPPAFDRTRSSQAEPLRESTRPP